MLVLIYLPSVPEKSEFSLEFYECLKESILFHWNWKEGEKTKNFEGSFIKFGQLDQKLCSNE